MARIVLSGGALDGLELHYTTAGRGPATLLIHGLGAFAESWRGTIAALASQGTVIALDLPGFGQSAKPRREYALPFFAEVVDRLLDALEVDRVRLVGHSLGGGVAVACALTNPARVERLALVSPVVPGFPLRPSLAYRLMALPGVGELVSALITPRICTAALARCFALPDPEEIAFLVAHQFRARTTPEGRAAYLATLRGVRADFTARAETYRAALARWDRPALVIHGRQDPVVPLAHAAAAAEGIRGAEGRWVERCGHFPQIEHAEAVNGWLGEFLFARARS
ncbi:MAG TPA: alpha/beta fold hydrolase [Methylomirabilota bacterium]|nr:alpha/beta fold hydrolase [Methylomirabilota bacterium]